MCSVTERNVSRDGLKAHQTLRLHGEVIFNKNIIECTKFKGTRVAIDFNTGIIAENRRSAMTAGFIGYLNHHVLPRNDSLITQYHIVGIGLNKGNRILSCNCIINDASRLTQLESFSSRHKDTVSAID